MKFAVVIEKAEHNYSAYVPDLPGCIAVGDTLKEVKQTIEEAIEFHLEGMLQDGDPVVEPTTHCCYVDVELPKPGKTTRRRSGTTST